MSSFEPSPDIKEKTPEQLLQELRVHQIELEMQNEELRRTQVDLEVMRARYFDLYDLAPVGYLTMNEKGLILEANLTAATLLGVDRGVLVKQLLTRFILPEDQDIYFRHRKQLFETRSPQVCELRIWGVEAALFWMRMEANIAQEGDADPLCRVMISDITEQKQAEETLQKAFDQIKTLRGILPICMHCKKIRDDRGYWNQVEVYVRDHSEADFSHGICPECIEKLYPESGEAGDGSTSYHSGGSL